jgi:hypothetical protein
MPYEETLFEYRVPRASASLPLAGSISLAAIVCLSNVAVACAQGATPQVVYSQFDPIVIRSDRIQPVLFTAKLTTVQLRVIF